jgi:hypothetical protein
MAIGDPHSLSSLRVETLSFEEAADFNPQEQHPVDDLVSQGRDGVT